VDYRLKFVVFYFKRFSNYAQIILNYWNENTWYFHAPKFCFLLCLPCISSVRRNRNLFHSLPYSISYQNIKTELKNVSLIRRDSYIGYYRFFPIFCTLWCRPLARIVFEQDFFTFFIWGYLHTKFGYCELWPAGKNDITKYNVFILFIFSCLRR